MEKLKTEGIITHAIPFRNYDCILTVFTPMEGLVKLFFRGAYSSKKGKGSGTTTPLSVVEIVYIKGRGDLDSCVEISVINHNLALRHRLSTLENACEILQTISRTQQPGKAAPELYQLLIAYLNKLPLVSDPLVITSSFRLKLLRYEGLLPQFSHCCVCTTALRDTWIHENEAFCLEHTPSEALSFTQNERGFMEHLAFCRDFTLFAGLNITALLSKKITSLFDSSITI